MSKFKIGDNVRIVCNTDSEFDSVKIGDVGVVANIYERDPFPISLRIGKHSGYGFKEEELELVTHDDNDFKLKIRNNTYSTSEHPSVIQTKEMWIKERKLAILDEVIKCAESDIVPPLTWVKELKKLE